MTSLENLFLPAAKLTGHRMQYAVLLLLLLVETKFIFTKWTFCV